MRTVVAAFTAATEGRFEELETLLAPSIDWRGVPDEDGHIPRCRGRAQALERMRVGLLASGEVSVSAFIEEGDRVLACVRAAGDEAADPRERFMVAEVIDGKITQLRGYTAEADARAALIDGFPTEPTADPEPGS